VLGFSSLARRLCAATASLPGGRQTLELRLRSRRPPAPPARGCSRRPFLSRLATSSCRSRIRRRPSQRLSAGKGTPRRARLASPPHVGHCGPRRCRRPPSSRPDRFQIAFESGERRPAAVALRSASRARGNGIGRPRSPARGARSTRRAPLVPFPLGGDVAPLRSRAARREDRSCTARRLPSRRASSLDCRFEDRTSSRRRSLSPTASRGREARRTRSALRASQRREPRFPVARFPRRACASAADRRSWPARTRAARFVAAPLTFLITRAREACRLRERHCARSPTGCRRGAADSRASPRACLRETLFEFVARDPGGLRSAAADPAAWSREPDRSTLFDHGIGAHTQAVPSIGPDVLESTCLSFRKCSP
jgi:hypothetical protein